MRDSTFTAKTQRTQTKRKKTTLVAAGPRRVNARHPPESARGSRSRLFINARGKSSLNHEPRHRTSCSVDPFHVVHGLASAGFDGPPVAEVLPDLVSEGDSLFTV